MIDEGWEAYKRDERKRKAGKSRVMSFSQREASLMNNLSAQGGRSKKCSDGRDRENYKTQEKGRNHHTLEPRCLPSERDEGYLL